MFFSPFITLAVHHISAVLAATKRDYELSCSCTWLLSALSSGTAVKEPLVACMCWTFLSCFCTWLAAVCAKFWITPGHNSPRFKNGGKAPIVAWMCWTFLVCSCTWLLSPPQSLRPRSQQPVPNGGKSADSGLDVLHVPRLLLHLAKSLRPQVTSAPDSRMAATAWAVAWMRWSCTWLLPSSNPRSQQPHIAERWQSTASCLNVLAFLSYSFTWPLSPPLSARPMSPRPQTQEWQQKNPLVAWMCWTFLSCPCSGLLSLPCGSPQANRGPRSHVPCTWQPVS